MAGAPSMARSPSMRFRLAVAKGLKGFRKQPLYLFGRMWKPTKRISRHFPPSRRLGLCNRKVNRTKLTKPLGAFFLPFLTEGYPLERNPCKSVCLLGPFWGVGAQKDPQIEHSDVVDIMGFTFGHVTPILRKTEKCQKKRIAKVGRLSFLTPQIDRYPS